MAILIEDDPGPGPFMCARCVSDEHLKQFIRENAVSHECDFCGRHNDSKPIAADAELVGQHVTECVEQELEDAAEMVPYESREGGYQAEIMTNEEVLYEEAGLEEVNEAAFKYLADALPDKAWVQKDFFSLRPHQILGYGWSGFSEAVKHQTRYLFFRKPKAIDLSHDQILPEEMLSVLGGVIQTAGLIRKIPAETLLYRVRPHGPKDHLSSIQELGPPPVDKARSNRLSPAGISMMYTSEDEATAIAETLNTASAKSKVTIATFRLDAPVRVVDFVRLPETQSIFTPNTTPESRADINFAVAFAREVSQQVTYDGSEHIEYVPTQVVTEFLRFAFRPERRRIRGIRYASARKPGGANVVLFVSHDNLLPSPYPTKPPVKLTLVSHRIL